MSLRTLKKAEWPDRLRDWLRRAGYRKHYVLLDLVDTVTVRQNRDWSGGSKDSQWAARANDPRETAHLYPSKPTAWPALEASEVRPADYGWVYIQGGTSCGKPSSWHLEMTEATWRDQFA